jgi:hypothetical protein
MAKETREQGGGGHRRQRVGWRRSEKTESRAAVEETRDHGVAAKEMRPWVGGDWTRGGA